VDFTHTKNFSKHKCTLVYMQTIYMPIKINHQYVRKTKLLTIDYRNDFESDFLTAATSNVQICLINSAKPQICKNSKHTTVI